jgi:CRP-like cAMP-binding protein
MPLNQIIYGYVASEETYPDKELLIEEGSQGDWVYVVLEGQAKVKKRTSKGTVTIATLKQGDILGEMALFGGGERVRKASVVADGPVRLGVLDGTRLLNEYETLCPPLRGLIKTLIVRLREASAKVIELATESR